MATGWFKSGIDAINGPRDLTSDTFKAVLLLDSYVFSSAHDNLDDISADAAVNGTTAALTITITDGVVDIDNESITPAISQDVDSYAIYYDSGVASTSTLIFYMDSETVANLPLATDGNPFNLTFDNGASKFFAYSPVL